MKRPPYLVLDGAFKPFSHIPGNRDLWTFCWTQDQMYDLMQTLCKQIHSLTVRKYNWNKKRERAKCGKRVFNAYLLPTFLPYSFLRHLCFPHTPATWPGLLNLFNNTKIFNILLKYRFCRDHLHYWSGSEGLFVRKVKVDIGPMNSTDYIYSCSYL